MRFPRMPIKGQLPIVVTITNGINESGAQNEVATFAGKCIFDEKTRTRRGGDNIDIILSGIAIIDGDIAPEVETLSGYAKIDGGESHKILTGRRIRDFSGTVHHTELELI